MHSNIFGFTTDTSSSTDKMFQGKVAETVKGVVGSTAQSMRLIM